MKANELMIGDWVIFRGHPHKVKGIYLGIISLEAQSGIDAVLGDFDAFLDDLQPVPLTPEILEKNGFQKQAGEIWEYDIFSKDKSLASMIVWRKDYATPRLTIRSFVLQYGIYSRRDIKYIHELQHALRLCGIEKEIEL